MALFDAGLARLVGSHETTRLHDASFPIGGRDSLTVAGDHLDAVTDLFPEGPESGETERVRLPMGRMQRGGAR